MDEKKKETGQPEEYIIEGSYPIPAGFPSIGYINLQFPWHELSVGESFRTIHGYATVSENFFKWLEIQPTAVKAFYRITIEPKPNTGGGTRVWRTS